MRDCPYLMLQARVVPERRRAAAPQLPPEQEEALPAELHSGCMCTALWAEAIQQLLAKLMAAALFLRLFACAE